MVPTSKVLQMNFMKFTTCFTPHHRWRGYRTSWSAKDVIGNSSHHMHRHFGGLWEAAVKSKKHHLRWTLGSHIATYEELYTLLAETEACLNSRPLCALSDDPFNPTYLSPGHFLIGEPLTHLPAADYTNVKCNRLSTWQTCQQLQQFWQWWSSDYLQSLLQCKPWQRTSPNLQIGDLILLREDNMTPLQWSTGVITDTHAGKDGIIRVVTLRTPKGTFNRPTTKICRLPHGNSEL